MKSKLGLAAALCLAAVTSAIAQDFPQRPVTLIVPAPPGGGTDIFARQLAEIVSGALKQKVIVENKPGGGGSVGVTQIVTARPDGYTLGFIWNSPLTTTPHSLAVAYAPENYAAVMSIGYSSYVICAQPDFPANTGKEMLEAIKASPGKFTFGNDGVGGTMQLAGERIFNKVGAKVRPVPFGGAGETARNFLGGHIDFYGGSLPPIIAHAKAGKAKCLLMTSAAGNAALPKASGLDEIGLGAEETVLWWGLIAPARVPQPVLQALEKAFLEAARSPAFRETMEKQGAISKPMGTADTTKLITDELKALGEVAASLKIERKSQ